jgi:CDP-diacylglycerol--glycerol-3-phosphate 3-phosphatidyltransferase
MVSPKTFWTNGAKRLAVPLAAPFVSSHITPNRLTVAGLLLNIGAAPLIVSGHFVWAFVVFVLASVCDLLDGAVARIAQQVTPFGGFLDSTSDRLAEGITLAALGVYYAHHGRLWLLGAVFVVLTMSFLVSYTRARAEALGMTCKVGLMGRPERIFVLATGFLFARWHVLTVVVWLLAALTTFTVVQRMLHVRAGMRAGAGQV